MTWPCSSPLATARGLQTVAIKNTAKMRLKIVRMVLAPLQEVRLYFASHGLLVAPEFVAGCSGDVDDACLRGAANGMPRWLFLAFKWIGLVDVQSQRVEIEGASAPKFENCVDQRSLRSGVPLWRAIGPPPLDCPVLDKVLACDVAVVGGGITGTLIGYYLTKAGVNTLVVDRDEMGLGSTAGSTGLLQYEIDTSLV